MERERETERERKTDREKDRERERQRQSQTETETEAETETETKRETEREGVWVFLRTETLGQPAWASLTSRAVTELANSHWPCAASARTTARALAWVANTACGPVLASPSWRQPAGVTNPDACKQEYGLHWLHFQHENVSESFWVSWEQGTCSPKPSSAHCGAGAVGLRCPHPPTVPTLCIVCSEGSSGNFEKVIAGFVCQAVSTITNFVVFWVDWALLLL